MYYISLIDFISLIYHISPFYYISLNYSISLICWISPDLFSIGQICQILPKISYCEKLKYIQMKQKSIGFWHLD